MLGYISDFKFLQFSVRMFSGGFWRQPKEQMCSIRSHYPQCLFHLFPDVTLPHCCAQFVLVLPDCGLRMVMAVDSVSAESLKKARRVVKPRLDDGSIR